jgi:hypothetical protein
MSVSLIDPQKQKDAGYFRIGRVELRIPPQEIQSNRGINNEEVVPIRAANAMYKKTGHSRWDFNVTWVALIDYTQANPNQNWEDVATIWAMARCAPFVEVYNKHINNLINQEGVGFSANGRMAFAIRQMRVETDSDIIDGLRVNLTLTLFNYLPYSKDFGYMADDGTSGPATSSTKFSNYVSRWMSENMRKDNGANWSSVADGYTAFDWRQYFPVYFSGNNNSASSFSVPSTPSSLPTSTGGASSDLVNTIALAIAKQEGFYTKGSVAQRNNNPGALSGSSYRDGADSRNYDKFDSVDKGWAALKSQIAKNVNRGLTFQEFFGGQRDANGNVIKGGYAGYAPTGDPRGANDPNSYANIIAKAVGIPSNVKINSAFPNGATSDVPTAVQAGPSQEGPMAPAAQIKNSQSTSGLNSAQLGLVDPYLNQGFLLDHATERCAFLYKQNTTEISNDESDDLFSTKVSVVLVNNLPQITFSNQVLPTYQSLGPPSVMVQFALISKAEQEDSGVEPIHYGLGDISSMVGSLESQFQILRSEWRAVSSVQRMQSVSARNKVLNLLGITGLMPQSFNTSTVPDSPEVVQGILTFSQYENIFEVLTPYLVKAGGQAYVDAWSKQLSDPANFSDLNPQQKGLVQPLINTAQYIFNSDPSILTAAMKDSPKSFPQVPLPAKVPLSQSDLQSLQQAMGATGSAMSKALANLPLSANSPLASTPKRTDDFASKFPESAARIKNGTPSYNDLLLLASVATNSSVPGILSSYNNRLAAAGEQPMHQLYNSYVSYRMDTDPLFRHAVQQYEISPQGKAAFGDLAQIGGPGGAPENDYHGAYRDLGLKSVSSSLDWTPANYFTDYSDEIRKDLLSQATPRAKTALDVASQLNGMLQDRISNKQFQSPDPTSTSQDLQKIIERVNVPAMSLKRAFPAMKVFFMEDDNSGIFNVFDDTYSYSSVLSAEIILYQDRPDYMVLTLTNFSNILTHKLFDGSILGTQEKNLENGKIPTPSPVAPGAGSAGADAGSVIGGSIASTDTANRTLGGQVLRDVLGGKMPLQYFPLQTGTKIQIRAGFDNNPDNLFPIFSGTVSAIEAASETLVVEAEGFLAELLKGPSSDIVRGYGGIIHRMDDGDANTVIGATLKNSGAEHFGHWVINPDQPSKFFKGFDSDKAVAGVVKGAGAGKLGTLLANGRDRTTDNIFINKAVHADGSQARNWYYERNLFGFKYGYSVPNDPSINAWRIIKDISRRYPELILSVKPYGFPYGNDATLVFSSVNDYYVCRNPTLSDMEGTDLTKDDDKSFFDWWNQTGEGEMRAMFNQGNVSRSGTDTDFAGYVYQIYAGTPNTATVSGFFQDLRGPEFFTSPSHWTNLLLNDIKAGGAPTFQAVLNAGLQALDYLQGSDWETSPASALFALERLLGTQELTDVGNAIDNRRKQLRHIFQEYLIYKKGLQSNDKSKTDSTLNTQPVRRWHLVTNESIIHNGITLNDKLYNCIKISDTILPANSAIPPQYRRILDVTESTIDPKSNIESYFKQGLANAYAQSFLREELGKMYRGELVIAGTPEIQPYDVILLVDLTRQIAGPIEVESVIHSFNMESGFITIIRPRALTVINEFASVGLWMSLEAFFSNLGGNASSAVKAVEGTGPGGPVTPVQAGTAAVGALGAIASTAAVGTLVSTILQSGSSLAGSSLFASAVRVGSAGLLGLSTWWVLLPIALGAAAVTVSAATKEQSLTPISILPLSQFGYPWVGGVQGWKTQNLVEFIVDRFQQFTTYEIAPTLEGFKKLAQVADAFKDSP